MILDRFLFFLCMLFVMGGFAILLIGPQKARSQHKHDLGHAQYELWQSNAGFGCCNQNDCGELPDKDVRERGGQYQVLVTGDPMNADEWCPVTFGHLVKSPPGKSPDWSRHHACILTAIPGRAPCERFRCFMGKVAL